jgi:hypothetical protein
VEIFRVLPAALAAYVFSAVWYTGMGRHWLPVSGVPFDSQGRPTQNGDAKPFVIGAIAYVIVAGIMRHILVMIGADSAEYGLMVGFGIGAFLITPWVTMNHGLCPAPRKTGLD